MARPATKVTIIAEISAIPPYRTESIGPLPIYRGEAVTVTRAEAEAYVLFGDARYATDAEVAAMEELEAYKAKLAAESAAGAETVDEEAVKAEQKAEVDEMIKAAAEAE